MEGTSKLYKSQIDRAAADIHVEKIKFSLHLSKINDQIYDAWT